MQCRVQCWYAIPHQMLMRNATRNVDAQFRAQCWCAIPRTIWMCNAVHNVWYAMPRTMLMCNVAHNVDVKCSAQCLMRNTAHNVDAQCRAQCWCAMLRTIVGLLYNVQFHCTYTYHKKNRNRKIWWLALNTFFGTMYLQCATYYYYTHVWGKGWRMYLL
jgi:hypothetical protein